MNLIRALRKNKAFTLTKFASLVKVSPGYLSQIEREQATPTIHLALRICKTLETDPYKVFPDWDARLKENASLEKDTPK
ncbi:MAG: hypothetical protein UT30_C0038G0004 [Candidatus Uhrbacteria bacterium GW2011_GWF2_39_13]|uniref:HTH cro/C1-type domain-containing protein n=1 Tax=Candidatus Uhrbacteria bacterium GW2011_GWF2_39_13 TaxID=1618995 RepID=A0A0G0MJ36_9BACT|nr:MAG: hypothetical protein UT30_C0038G0004 [Candidatus Uhrbacteria bacterium GW2011_GWF2_39_13]